MSQAHVSVTLAIHCGLIETKEGNGTIPRVHVNDITQLNVDCPIWTNEHVTSCSLSTGRCIISHVSLSGLQRVESSPIYFQPCINPNPKNNNKSTISITQPTYKHNIIDKARYTPSQHCSGCIISKY